MVISISNLQIYKRRELWGLLAEVYFEVIYIFGKCGFKYMTISQTLLYLQENK